METKQVIVMRTKFPDGKGDFIGLRKGKEIAQGAHASGLWLTKRMLDCHKLLDAPQFSPSELEWMEGSYAKIVLQVQSEDELIAIFVAATNAGLTVNMVTDLGKTEFNGVPTKTCLAIGPHEADKINPLTQHLKLY
jgi:PTH2 family peptidyl-tRNA hydrolase